MFVVVGSAGQDFSPSATHERSSECRGTRGWPWNTAWAGTSEKARGCGRSWNEEEEEVEAERQASATTATHWRPTREHAHTCPMQRCPCSAAVVNTVAEIFARKRATSCFVESTKQQQARYVPGPAPTSSVFQPGRSSSATYAGAACAGPPSTSATTYTSQTRECAGCGA